MRAARLALCCCLLAAAWTTAAAAHCKANAFDSASILRSQLNTLCDMRAPSRQSTASACTLWRMCSNSTAASAACDATVVFSTLCLEVPATGACTKFVASYGDAAGADGCLKGTAIALPSADTAMTAIQGMCSVHTMTGCPECGGGSCSDPLGTYAIMCLEMRMSQCKEWQSMCRTTGANGTLGSLCTKARPAPLPATPCISDSSSPECRSYRYPDNRASADMEALCASMPAMSGCSIWSKCKASELRGTYCEPFNALASTCNEMPGMSDCKNYAALCLSPNTTVQQCQDYRGVPRLPSGTAAEKAIQEMCGTHSMQNCASCTKAPGGCPDPLSSLAALCKEMPGMSQCNVYSSWCDAAGAGLGAYCQFTSQDIPPMTMWFHQRLGEVVLSLDWITRTPGAYAGTIFAILAFGVVSTALKVARGRFDAQWIHDSLCSHASAAAAAAGACCSKHAAQPSGPLQRVLALTVTQNSIRALLTGGSSLLDYLNMLIVMTFNVGFVIAAVGGYMLGTVLLSHLVVPQHSRRRGQLQQRPSKDDGSHGSSPLLKGLSAWRFSGDRVSVKDVEAGQPDQLAVAHDLGASGSGSGSEPADGDEEAGCPACAAAKSVHSVDVQPEEATARGVDASAMDAAARRESAYQQAALHHAGDGCC